MHAAAGGTAGGPDISSGLYSSDMLLESLVTCFGVTVRAVSTSMGIPTSSGSITAKGDLDFRGTLGVKAEDGSNVSVGFQKINLVTRLDAGDEYKGQVDKLISLSERYCVVLQTLRSGVTAETKLRHVGKAQRDARRNAELADSGESGKADGGDKPHSTGRSAAIELNDIVQNTSQTTICNSLNDRNLFTAHSVLRLKLRT
jgi:uncharacterized OsmC-like protein